MSEIDEYADNLDRIHKHHKSCRPLGKKHNKVGSKGEELIAIRYGWKVDTILRPGGDGGKDFKLPDGRTIDVKTARKAYNLLVERGKVRADIFILCQYFDDTDSCEALGWATKEEVLAIPVRDVGGYGVISHAISVHDLRPMEELDKLAT